MSTQDRKQKEAKIIKEKKRQRYTVKRRMRQKKLYQRKVKYDKACQKHNHARFITFVENWSGSGKYINGNNRRGTSQYYTQLNASSIDHVIKVDEYASTVTCSSCFQRTFKQPVRREGKIKRIPGAVVCINTSCPRRLSCNATTINRDRNAAWNITLIEFSTLVGQDNLSLPAFQRIRTNK